MTQIQQTSTVEGSQLTRRGLLQCGALATLGLTVPQLLQAEAGENRRFDLQAGQRRPTGEDFKPTAKSCILFFMEGGPSHIDMWRFLTPLTVEDFEIAA